MDVNDRRLDAEFWRRFRETTDLGLVVLGLNGQILQVNSEFLQFTGYTESEMLGRTIVEFTHPSDGNTAMADVSRLLQGELPVLTQTKRYLRRDQKYTTFVAIRSRVIRHPDTDAPLFLLSDIMLHATTPAETEQIRQAQEQLQRELTAFVERHRDELDDLRGDVRSLIARGEGSVTVETHHGDGDHVGGSKATTIGVMSPAAWSMVGGVLVALFALVAYIVYAVFGSGGGQRPIEPPSEAMPAVVEPSSDEPGADGDVKALLEELKRRYDKAN